MHPDQQAFVEAFKAWDGAAMADALARIANELGQVECSEETRSELTWSCREFFECMEDHTSIGTGFFVPEGPISFVLGCDVRKSGEGPPARHPMVTLQLAPSAVESEALKSRWGSLGLDDKAIAIDREEVRTPVPFVGEPGHPGDRPGRPSIHRPGQVVAAGLSETYAHALAVEFGGTKSRLDRYRAGDREQVWRELTSLGAGVREESVLPDAIAVVRETMRRCRENVEALAERLRSMGYHFGSRITRSSPRKPTSWSGSRTWKGGSGRFP